MVDTPWNFVGSHRLGVGCVTCEAACWIRRPRSTYTGVVDVVSTASFRMSAAHNTSVASVGGPPLTGLVRRGDGRAQGQSISHVFASPGRVRVEFGMSEPWCAGTRRWDGTNTLLLPQSVYPGHAHPKTHSWCSESGARRTGALVTVAAWLDPEITGGKVGNVGGQRVRSGNRRALDSDRMATVRGKGSSLCSAAAWWPNRGWMRISRGRRNRKVVSTLETSKPGETRRQAATQTAGIGEREGESV